MGTRLREARIASRRDLADLARELRIRDAWLLAIEEGRLDELPDGPYRIAFVRSYAERLGLDGAALAAQLRPARSAAEGGEWRVAFLLDKKGSLSGHRVLVLAAMLAAVAGGGWYVVADSVSVDRTVPMAAQSRGPVTSSPKAGQGRDAAPVSEPAAARSAAGSAVPELSTKTDARPPDGAANTAPSGEPMRPSADETRSAAPGPPTAGRIRAVQRALIRLGYDPGPVDGAIGSRTRAAIRAFQVASGLTADGKLTPELEREIVSGAAAPGS